MGAGTGEVEAGATLVPARPDVIDEVVAGEAVVVHLGTGRYYAFNRSATLLWTWFEAGLSVEALDGHQDLPPAWRAAAVELAARWRSDGLLVPGSPEEHGRDVAAAPGAVPDELAAEAPADRSFTDLEDLLLLDPIHDVAIGPDGFPTPRPG